MDVLRAWLPYGQGLPESTWRTRHRAVIWLLMLHGLAFAVYGLLAQLPALQILTDVSVPVLGAYVASRSNLPRLVRSSSAAISLMLTSGVVVHLMNGSIEGHFHFFVLIPIVALYEDWVPFGLAVAIVLLHHGVMGTLSPEAVYDHAAALEHPWRWAFVHAAFFGSACVGALLNWKLHETARTAEQSLLHQVRHQAHHDALTGLPNRAQLLEYAELLRMDPALRGEPVAVLLVDLDRFKEVNDVLGHAISGTTSA